MLKALDFVCSQVGWLPPALSNPNKPLKKKHYATSLLNWRLEQWEQHIGRASSSTQKGHILNLDNIKDIWQDIEIILTPSWMTAVPLNLGSKSHGKLKADQWRTLGTVYLPLSLI
ncbi:hypothetical protein CPB83DRAFT_897180 [Crepidotus variabilis]|uniref:Uncharacterized protein n=1 Tax=Crepidotus variabilis TaxID=179855 RepID=A0A9P6EA65_9AGAR|nr:hypothetical protein CPB83DRAFT_897180 [Crepidotus variabilis]